MRYLLLLLAFAQDGTRIVQHGEERVEIVLPVSTPDKSVTAAVSFPEDGIDSIVVSWDESALSLERRKGRLFLKLLKPSRGDIHVIGASGRLYRLHLRPARKDEARDAHVRIERREKKKPVRTPAIEMIRAMRTGRSNDFSVLAADRSLAKGFTLRYVYDNASYIGYVVEIDNLGPDTYRIDPSRFSSDRLVLIGAREMKLEPESSTLLYLVFWK